MRREYKNIGYGSGERNRSILNITEENNGTINQPIVVRSYPGETPKLTFDEKVGIIVGERFKPVKHIERGFEVDPIQN